MVVASIALGNLLAVHSFAAPTFVPYEATEAAPVAVVRSAHRHVEDSEAEFYLGVFTDPDPFGLPSVIDSVWAASFDVVHVRLQIPEEVRGRVELPEIHEVETELVLILNEEGALLAAIAPDAPPQVPDDAHEWYATLRQPQVALSEGLYGRPIKGTRQTAVYALGFFWAYSAIWPNQSSQVVVRPRHVNAGGVYWASQGIDVARQKAMTWILPDDKNVSSIRESGRFLSATFQIGDIDVGTHGCEGR